MRRILALSALLLLSCGPAPTIPPGGGREECGAGETCSCNEAGAWLVRAGGVLLVEAACLVECVPDGPDTAPCEFVIGGEGASVDAACGEVDCVVRSSEGGCAEFDAPDGPPCLEGCRGSELCGEAAECTVSAEPDRCDCACP